MHVNPDQLPDHTSISQPDISKAAAHVSAMRVEADEARKSKVQAELELPAAKDADATEDERLRAEGKPKLKGRPATVKAEKMIADLEHEQVGSHKTVIRAERELAEALDHHGDEWLAEVDKLVGVLDESWDKALEKLVELHEERSRAIRIARTVGSDHAAIGTIALGPVQRFGVEVPHGGSTTAHVDVETILAAFQEVGKPKVEEPKEPAVPIKTLSPTIGMASVDQEIAERRAHESRLKMA